MWRGAYHPEMVEEPNLYAAPRVKSLDPPDQSVDADTRTDATTGQRFGTFILDYIGFMVFSFGVGFGMVMIDGTGRLISAVPEFAFGIIVMTIYYVGFEATLGRTPGKMIMGTRVIAEQGEKVTFLQVLGRTFARFVPFEAFSALGGGQMWHDSWSKTRVVTTR